MVDKNLEAFSIAHAKSIADPTVRNLLEAAQAALRVTDAQNDVQSAWTWYAVAMDLASTGGIKFQPVESRFPPTWHARKHLEHALEVAPGKAPEGDRLALYSLLSQALFTWESQKTRKNALLAARAALNMSEASDIDWMAWSWTEMADGLASEAECELSSLGFARCPDVISGLSDIETALTSLEQEGA